MAVDFYKEDLGGGVTLGRVTDKKFKCCSVKIAFITKNTYDATAKNALLFSVLATSNAKHPSRLDLAEETEGLYGTYLSAFSAKSGDMICSGLSCAFISDVNTIGKEIISTKAVQLMLDCLFEPHLEDGLFNEEIFSQKQKELSDSIAASVNNKRAYAIREARKVIFKDEPAMYSDYGSPDDALSVTRQDLLDYYKMLRETAAIEISISGDGTTAECEALIKKAFEPFTKRAVAPVRFRSNSPLKPEPVFAGEDARINQSKMVMAFKSDYEDIYTVKLFCTLFGTAQFSMLFENVRERLSLCYYCPSVYVDTKGTMIVDCGVETANIEAAKDEIIRQLSEAAAGAFSDELLENSKRYICDSFKSNYDSPFDMQDWYIVQTRRGTAFSPDEICAKFNAVTRQEIEQCAASFKLDTVYTLKAVSEVSGDE